MGVEYTHSLGQGLWGQLDCPHILNKQMGDYTQGLCQIVNNYLKGEQDFIIPVV
jgi:hypothetical protein